jgi:hypothetical protein
MQQQLDERDAGEDGDGERLDQATARERIPA